MKNADNRADGDGQRVFGKKQADNAGQTDKTNIRFFLNRIIKSKNWSLRTRFVYTTGALIFCGALLTLAIVQFSLKQAVEITIHTRLDNYAHIVRLSSRDIYRHLAMTAVTAADDEYVVRAMVEKNGMDMQHAVQKLLKKIYFATGFFAPDMQVYHTDGDVLYSTVGYTVVEHEDREIFGDTVTAPAYYKHREVLKTAYVLPGRGPVFSVTMPVFHDNKLIGFVKLYESLDNLFKKIEMPSEYGMALALDNRYADVLGKDTLYRHYGSHLILFISGNQELYNGLLGQPRDKNNTIYDRDGAAYSISLPFVINNGQVTGQIVLLYDASSLLVSSGRQIYFISWLTISSALIILVSLYLNVERIRKFLTKLKNVITASHSSDFSSFFPLDNVHCLEVMHCNHRECPVHNDPDKVCYLETGDQAISSRWRFSCIFLNKYKTCRQCPVYKMRHGDELMEIGQTLNTVMRLWDDFLARVSGLLSTVLLHDDTSTIHSLDDVSHYVEHLAQLTVYADQLQGVLDKKELFRHLEWAMADHFSLSVFNFVEVNSADNEMEVVINRMDSPGCHGYILTKTELCRAKRVGEDVISMDNLTLCPYFYHDSSHVRCCLPVVMGGQVGAIFSFLVTKAEWNHKKNDLVIIKKYLIETAPVFASLRLLELSQQQAMHDALTGCYNRRFMDEYLEQCQLENERASRMIGFIMVDMDYFKMVNDDFGHPAGDKVLQDLADILRKIVRKSDIVVRYGGEEFLVMLLDVNNKEITYNIAEKIRKNVEQTEFILPSGRKIKKTISLGVADYPYHTDLLQKAIDFADLALYAAKENGRNRMEVFNKKMLVEAEGDTGA